MTHALHDPVRHNAWATAQFLEFCQGLDEQTLNASVPGSYGTIIATLTTGLDVLMERAALLATDWEVFLVLK
jgi:hypothetical protein